MRATGRTNGRTSGRRRDAAALGAAVLALLAGTAGCTGGTESAGAAPATGSAVAALTAAAQTTREITSADFEASTSAPASLGGDAEMTGSLSWEDGLAMNVTVSSGQFAADPAVPDEMPVVWLNGVMYMEMGAGFAAEFGGRQWMRMDLMAIVEATGDRATTEAMSHGLDQAGQDPRQQLGLLLQSLDIDRVGEENLDGVPVDHYQGTISAEDALRAGGGPGVLTEREREEVAEVMSELGIDSYAIDVWVTEDDFPVRTRQTYDTDEGPVQTEVTYENLGTEVTVTEPPAGSFVDFMDLLDGMAPGGRP